MLSVLLLPACSGTPPGDTVDVVTDTQAPSNPQITINNADSETTSTTVDILLSAYDISGVNRYYISESPETPAIGTHQWVSETNSQDFSLTIPFVLSAPSQIGSVQRTIYIWFSDIHGNISSMASDQITLTISDNTSPQNESISINNGDNSTTSTNVTLSISAEDNIGIMAYFVSENETTPSVNSSEWSLITNVQNLSRNIPFSMSGENQTGTYTRTVYAWFKDDASNISSRASDTIMLEISDSEAPSAQSLLINTDASSTDSINVTVSLVANDNVGITGYLLSSSSSEPLMSSSEWVSILSSSNIYIETDFTLPTETIVGSYTKNIYVWFRDDAGNLSPAISDTITLIISDTTAPSNNSIEINNGDSTTETANVSIDLVAFDNVGIGQYLLSGNNITPRTNDARWVQLSTAVSAYTESISYDLPSSNGTKTVYAWFMDESGNISTVVSDSILLNLASSAVDLGINWMAFGDSETNGRAFEPSAESPIIAFQNIWNQTQSSPQSVYVNAIGGRELIETYDAYLNSPDQNLATWVHFQESGGQFTTQVIPEEFVSIFETMVRAISQNSPNAIISTETAYSFEAEDMTNPPRDWTQHNIQMRIKIEELRAEGLNIYLAEVDRNIKELVTRKRAELGTIEGQQVVWGDENNIIERHYTGLGNFMLALSMFHALGYDIGTLDHSLIITNEVSLVDKNLCIEIINSF